MHLDQAPLGRGNARGVQPEVLGVGDGAEGEQDVVATRHQDDLRAQGLVGGRKLRAGNPGADDEARGHLGEVVELLPGENAFIIRRRLGQQPRTRTGRNSNDVGG